MSLISYKEALKMGKEALNDLMVGPKVNKARKQAELEMCKLDEDLASKMVKLQEACSSDNVNFSSIIDIQDSIALVKRRKQQYQTILDEMFPQEK